MASAAEITKNWDYDPDDVQRVATRRVRMQLEIVEPNPEWPNQFEKVKAKILEALGTTALTVNHVGSTSVPDLPAKAVIDIDVVVPDPTDEAAYIPKLEAAGFHFLLREIKWHQHRFLVLYDPFVNLHIFGPACPEVERHQIMRDWLINHEDDRKLYADTKRQAAKATVAVGENVQAYNFRKENVIREILERAFRARGLLT
jgi:GrpB-like predicted nucleotidyltransferase (UPF0157 family)